MGDDNGMKEIQYLIDAQKWDVSERTAASMSSPIPVLESVKDYAVMAVDAEAAVRAFLKVYPDAEGTYWFFEHVRQPETISQRVRRIVAAGGVA